MDIAALYAGNPGLDVTPLHAAMENFSEAFETYRYVYEHEKLYLRWGALERLTRVLLLHIVRKYPTLSPRPAHLRRLAKN
jgi:hypothetical protein